MFSEHPLSAALIEEQARASVCSLAVSTVLRTIKRATISAASSYEIGEVYLECGA